MGRRASEVVSRTWSAVACAGLVVACAVSIASARRRFATSSVATSSVGSAQHDAPCREPSRADPQRAERVKRMLLGVPHPSVTALRAEIRRTTICFVSGASMLVEGEHMLVDASLSDERAAARVGHLALHVAQPPWMPPSSVTPSDRRAATCDQRVEQALQRETEAWTLELEVARRLGAGSARAYPFEPRYWRTPVAQRRGMLESLLAAGDAAQGVPALAESYRARCAEPTAGGRWP